MELVPFRPAQGFEDAPELPEENEFYLETHDPHMTRFLLQYLKPGYVFLDIGAHIGYYTLVASRLVGARGKVFALEPSPESASRLREHVAENGCDANTSALEFAASDHDGYLEFLEFETSTLNRVKGQAGIDSAVHLMDGQAARMITTPCRKIDSLVQEGVLPPPNAVKIDVEGYELHVLTGMETTLGKSNPWVLAELHSGVAAQEVTAFMAARGYLSYHVHGPSPTRIHEALPEAGTNVLFARQGSL